MAVSYLPSFCVKPRELLFFFAALLFSPTVDAEHKPLYSYWLIIKSSFPYYILNMFTNTER